ncbi:MAG TPA: hypothetical protein H9837_07700 [Candidatus Brachybacterium merdigallinarum]|nr:hypothetical protein [Candidatus Brachybacterium merdigallinarum]
MTTFLRTTLTRTATGLGAVALALGAAACTAGGEEDTAATDGTTAETEEDGAPSDAGGASDDGGESDAEEPAASDGGGEGEIGEEDLTAAGDRLLDALQTADDGDAEALCAYTLDPQTNLPPEGEALEECAAGVEETIQELFGGELQPGMFDIIQRDMIEPSDNGDGTIAVALNGQEAGFRMVQGADDQWYLQL